MLATDEREQRRGAQFDACALDAAPSDVARERVSPQYRVAHGERLRHRVDLQFLQLLAETRELRERSGRVARVVTQSHQRTDNILAPRIQAQ